MVNKTSDGYRINQKDVSGTSLMDHVRKLDDYLVIEHIQQHDYADTIYPHSLNTIRFLTVIDPDTHRAEIILTSHRFGNSKSRPTDNVSRGAIGAAIDSTTGELLYALTPYGDPPIEKISVPPETQAQISGVRIPRWEDLCNMVLNLANHHHRVNLIGWDCTLSINGPITIEANPQAGLFFNQLEEGLLKNETVRKIITNEKNQN